MELNYLQIPESEYFSTNMPDTRFFFHGSDKEPKVPKKPEKPEKRQKGVSEKMDKA